MRPRIKICGITTAGDARRCAALGADYLGLVFAPSPRRVSLARAQRIRDAVPQAKLVGVFQDAAVDGVVHDVESAGIDLVQLHGSETPQYCDELKARTARPIIKSFGARRNPAPSRLDAYGAVRFFLFDLDKETLDENGEGTERLWERVSWHQRQGYPVFLAGGLQPDNVREAIARTGAYGVDVCRGVERRPGAKDPLRLERFFAEVWA